MESMIIDGNAYYLPCNISEVQSLIKMARQQRTTIRVRGSNHSVKSAIYPTNPDSKPGIYVMLTNMRNVEFETVTVNGAEQIRVHVQGGCNLGWDPFDPTRKSTWKNSLFCQMNERGLAVPDTGGIIHQTISGFLSTGSSGGSIKYSIDDCIYSITFIPADSDDPQPITVCRDDANPDEFYAAGVSMGLLGIIVSVTLIAEPTFNIIGSEVTSQDASPMGYDFLGKSTDPNLPTFQQFMEETDYARVIWYPQPHINKLTTWKATRVAPTKDFKPNPYWEFGKTPVESFMAMFGIDIFYTLAGQWPDWYDDIFANAENLNPVEQVMVKEMRTLMQSEYYPKILPAAINLFVPNNNNPDSPKESERPKEFQDYWWSSLPMDNQVSDKLMPVEFTEIWIDINKTTEVMNRLQDVFANYYAQECPGPEGGFNTEIYAAKASDFWLSPSYKRNVVRIDVFWWAHNKAKPTDSFYPMFWNALQDFDYRCHWGKYQPSANNSQVPADYLVKQYPKYNDFMALREKYDPLQVFVNDYWKQQLLIPEPSQSIA